MKKRVDRKDKRVLNSLQRTYINFKEWGKEVFCHVVEHIINDMPKKGYIIGIDMQYSDMEKDKNDSISAVMETMANFFV